MKLFLIGGEEAYIIMVIYSIRFSLVIGKLIKVANINPCQIETASTGAMNEQYN